jgi:hypothetical protein
MRGDTLPRRGDTSPVDRLDQLYARSRREIEAHTDELGDTSTGRNFIDEAAQLLSALRTAGTGRRGRFHIAARKRADRLLAPRVLVFRLAAVGCCVDV